MRFGLFTLFDFFPERQNEADYYRRTLELISQADASGIDSVWVGEEHFYSFGICPRPAVFLSAVAQRTRRIRLGTAVSLLPFDNPVRTAEDFAMLDIVSGGRVDFGVGRGLIPAHFAGFAVEPAESRARMNEALEVIAKAWTQQRFSHEGRFYRYPELSLSPKPLQRPHPPIWVGVTSPESFEHAGVTGQNVMIVPFLSGPFPRVKERVQRYRTLLREHGHDSTQVKSMFVFFLFVDPEYQTALSEAREVSGRYIKLVRNYLAAPKDAPHAVKEQFNLALQYIDRVTDEIEERAIVGTPADCRRRIEELRREFGIEHLAFYLHAGARDMDRAGRALELFSREVAPYFRE
ncbi:MAG: LLM class flavin-dependent oxidoreductase [Candidatus Binatus sp.]|uniref:LLM class flavin-dependent oxidoreductase n=1 Tax=Candidatus Binatus sp. TaxID=2811406 RepID=UPI00271B0A12|nr:LLM class flavin-dependent oxidoreductase [Candidatus Binatus sp.]MDO8434271.1 LLM class flavin-dependent oxidoreductase [Candidatus Binatus sp.]